MYFPYLRGKQFELIAIRELIENDKIGNNILPIIEIVSLSPTLRILVERVIEKNKQICLIHNPKVGNSVDDLDEIASFIHKYRDEDNVLVGHIVTRNSENEISKVHFCDSNKLIYIHPSRNAHKNYEMLCSKIGAPKYNIIDESARRRIKKNKVLLKDSFPQQVRNSDYLDIPYEDFSEEHVFYKDEGYDGFADYSVITSDFSDGGFAPYAVAIHIIDYAEMDDSFIVRHFVSDSNYDIQNPAGKFSEALGKLVDWNKNDNHRSIKTIALDTFQEYYDVGKFPGLGVVKKLSIMHHIELVNQYITKD